MKAYTEEQVNCLLSEIEDKVEAGKYGGDNSIAASNDEYVRSEMMIILREVTTDKDLIIRRRLG